MKGDSIDVVKDLLDRIDEVIEVSSGQPSLDSLLERISSIENSIKRSTMEKADVQQELLKLKVQLEAKDLKTAELLSRSDGLVNQLEQKKSELNLLSTERDGLVNQLEEKKSELNLFSTERDGLVNQLEEKKSELKLLSTQCDVQANENVQVHKKAEELAIRVEAEASARKSAEEEVKSSLVQLHQVQEELEHYFLLSRRQFKMLESSSKLQERTAMLLAGANNLQ